MGRTIVAALLQYRTDLRPFRGFHPTVFTFDHFVIGRMGLIVIAFHRFHLWLLMFDHFVIGVLEGFSILGAFKYPYTIANPEVG